MQQKRCRYVCKSHKVCPTVKRFHGKLGNNNPQDCPAINKCVCLYVTIAVPTPLAIQEPCGMATLVLHKYKFDFKTKQTKKAFLYPLKINK